MKRKGSQTNNDQYNSSKINFPSLEIPNLDELMFQDEDKKRNLVVDDTSIFTEINQILKKNGIPKIRRI